MKNTDYSGTAFIIAIIAGILFSLGISIHVVYRAFEYSQRRADLGTPLLLFGCFIGVVGTIVSFIGINEPKSIKKTIAMIINFGFSTLLIVMFIINLFDIIKAFS